MLAVILAIATAFFLFWGRPLWSVPPGSSHVARIAYSYLLALPMVAAALLAKRRWSWAHLFGGVAVIWGAKLLITATVYGYLAMGSASQYSPSKPWEASPAEPQRLLGGSTAAFRARCCAGAGELTLAEARGKAAAPGSPPAKE